MGCIVKLIKSETPKTELSVSIKEKRQDFVQIKIKWSIFLISI